ncbi:MAG: hypothetical protein ACC656_07740, partial [Candidatus Heimdallarchaeota archaeon]
TIIYLVYNRKLAASLSSIVILNLFVILQIYWTSEVLIERIEYHVFYLISFIAVVTYTIYTVKQILLKPRADNSRLYYDLPALGISPVFILSFIQISQIIIYDFQLNNQLFNQVLGSALLVTAGLMIAADQKINSSNLTDGFVISAFLTGLGMSLFGFFNSVVSNILISLIIFIFIVAYILSKSVEVLNIAKGLYILSLIKVIIDLFILDTLERGISFFAVGINGILFALISQSDNRSHQIENTIE